MPTFSSVSTNNLLVTDILQATRINTTTPMSVGSFSADETISVGREVANISARIRV